MMYGGVGDVSSSVDTVGTVGSDVGSFLTDEMIAGYPNWMLIGGGAEGGGFEMPKTKRKKNFLGFGKGNLFSTSTTYHVSRGGSSSRSKKSSKAAPSSHDNLLNDIAKGMGGKSYASLSESGQATVRKLAAKMNPKRKRNAGPNSHRKTKKRAKSLLGPYRYPKTKPRNHPRKRNLEIGLPKNKWANAKVRMKGGKIQVMADERVLGKAGFKAGAGLSGVSVSGGAKLNPTTRTYKTKGRPEKLKTLMERRKSRAKAGRWGTKKSERYLVGTPYLSTSDRLNAATVTAAKKKGKAPTNKSGDGVFWIQNQVTGSITNYKVS